jgi:hypothetical protein
MMEYHSVVDIVKQILDQYDFPLTVRQIYYQLVSHHSFPNKQSTYTRLSKILVKARENGDIDEFKIADRSRDVYAIPTYPNLETFYTHTFVVFLDNLKDYNRNLWLNQDVQVIVWIEKDALAEVVARASLTYQVPVFPSRGYASYTYIRSVWNRINMHKPLIVLHFADHDPSGLNMTEDLEVRLVSYLPRVDVRIERVALNYDQIKQHNLPPSPVKLSDPRAKWYTEKYGNQSWELDALDPKTLQSIVENSIMEHINSEVWNKDLEQYNLEKQKLETLIPKIRETLLGYTKELTSL